MIYILIQFDCLWYYCFKNRVKRLTSNPNKILIPGTTRRMRKRGVMGFICPDQVRTWDSPD